MKKQIQIIDVSPQLISDILKRAKTKIPSGKSNTFKDEMMVHVRNYFVERHVNRKPTISDTKKRLTQIIKDSDRITNNLQIPDGYSGSEVTACLNRGALMNKLDLNLVGHYSVY